MFSLRTGSLLHLPSSLRAPPFCSNNSSKMVSNAVTGFSISIKKQKKQTPREESLFLNTAKCVGALPRDKPSTVPTCSLQSIQLASFYHVRNRTLNSPRKNVNTNFKASIYVKAQTIKMCNSFMNCSDAVL